MTISLFHQSISTCHSDLSQFSIGHILNLVSNDAQRMEESVSGLMMALTTPIEILATIILMWIYIGWQSLSGVLYFVFLLIYNLLASKEFAKLRLKVADVTDKRLSVLNDVICGMRAVKMYAWEWSFRDVVTQLRRSVYHITPPSRSITLITNTKVVIHFGVTL
jgi:ABC-type multidrug transport system fused ATPase/permease subunit